MTKIRRILILVLLAIAFCSVVEKTEELVIGLKAVDFFDARNQIKNSGQNI